MNLLYLDIISTLIYTVSMACLLYELWVLNPEAQREWQTWPMLLAVTTLYVVVIWKTHALVALFTVGCRNGIRC